MAGSKLELIYYKSPVLIQNLLVSTKGLILKKIRKTGLYNTYKEAVLGRSEWHTKQFEDYQLKQYKLLIDYAKSDVPHYRQTFGHSNISSKSINCLKDIQKLPILKRETIKSKPKDFISETCHPKHRVSLHTTGTTGSPLRVESDRLARQKNYAFFDSYLKSIGLNPNNRHIILGGRIIVPQNSIKPPFWRYSYFQKALLMSSYHLNEKFMDDYINKIESFSPEYIESYPSSIYTLAKYILQKKRTLQCKAIVTSAETLFPEQREVIERAFNTKVYDQYGCAEMTFFVGQCSNGQYHVRPDYGLLEILDDDDKPVENGQPGRVICTGFINKVMPLIRYEIGDMATLSESDKCNCGLNTPILKEIQGRADDVLLTSDGQSIGRMSPVLKDLPIQESQYIQHRAGEVELLIVPDATFSEEDTNRIIDAVHMRLGDNFKVDVHIVEQIKRGNGGKLKAVISHVKHQNI